jgi:hypothetical protein
MSAKRKKHPHRHKGHSPTPGKPRPERASAAVGSASAEPAPAQPQASGGWRWAVVGGAMLALGLGLYALTGGKGSKPNPASASVPNPPVPTSAPVSASAVASEVPTAQVTKATAASGSAAQALPAGPVRQGPRIQFANTEHDFGKVQAGQVVKCAFLFTNVGDALLEISGVQTSCGCTTAGAFQRQVQPGQTGTIPIQFNSGGFSGPVTKAVTVTCNDPAQPAVQLLVKATVWAPIELTPQWAVLHVSPEQPSNAAVVRIVSQLEEPLVVSNLACTVPGIGLELITNQPGKEYAVLARTLWPWPTNSFTGQVSLDTSAAQVPRINFTVWVNYQPAVAVVPWPVMVPPGPLTNRHTVMLQIRNNSTNALNVWEPTLNVPDVQVQLTPGDLGRVFILALTFPPGFQLPADEPVELSVKTSHPQHPVIRVPIQPVPGATAGVVK